MCDEDDNDRLSAKSEVVIRKYGLLQPNDWSDDCENELRLMDEFWNKLVDIHQDYVSRYLSRIARDEEFAAAKREFDDLVASEAPPAISAASKKQLAIAQKNATRRLAVELRQLETLRREDVKVARQNSGLWWSNYNALVRSFERARNAALRGGGTMRHRSSDNANRITNTLQGGADVEALYDGSLSQVMVRPPSERAFSAESRGERRRLQRTTLTATVFVRDGERRTVTWPLIMHRPIPADCRLKEVIITRRRQEGRWRWTTSFRFTRPAQAPPPVPATARCVAVDIGWRRVPEGVRVATVLASGEKPLFITLPSDLIESFSLIDELRDRVRASSLQGLNLLESADTTEYEQPFQDLLSAFQSMPDKRPAHLSQFCQGAFFLKQPLTAIDDKLLRWRKEYRKLTIWQSNHQKKIIGRRNHFYQNIVVDIAKFASEIVMNDIKIGEIAASKPSAPVGALFPNRSSWYRTVAAPSELIRALKLQAEKRGIAFIRREAESPIRCPECGSTSRKTRADALTQICDNCGTGFDPDVATCQFLLAPVQPIRRLVTTSSAPPPTRQSRR